MITVIWYYWGRARYLDPRTGSWLGDDPVVTEPSYAYAWGTPLDLFDPDGTSTVDNNVIASKRANDIKKALKASNKGTKGRGRSGQNDGFARQVACILTQEAKLLADEELAKAFLDKAAALICKRKGSRHK